MNEIIKYMIDNNLGDLASILGLIIAVIGFAITIIGVWKSKSAADSATDAANQAREAISRTETIANFSSAVTAMEEVKRLHRADAWEVMPDRYASLRKTLITILTNHKNLTDEHKASIRSAVTQFRELENSVENYLANKKTSPNSAKLNKLVTSQIDKLDEVLHFIKADTGENND